MKQATGIIPARFDSRRFPGKALVHILGKPMIQRVYERAQTAKYLDHIIIATDDERIFQAAKSFGAEVRMTAANHNSGTERAAEIAETIDSTIIINVQGDEPLLNGHMINDLVETLQDETIPMATLVNKIEDLSLIEDTNIVKVVSDKDGYALYFSRAPLPFQTPDYFWQHVGIYGYQRDFLLKFNRLPPSRLEKTEKLEQLRVLESGYRIKILETSYPTLSIDTPQDIITVENSLKKKTND